MSDRHHAAGLLIPHAQQNLLQEPNMFDQNDGLSHQRAMSRCDAALTGHGLNCLTLTELKRLAKHSYLTYLVVYRCTTEVHMNTIQDHQDRC